MYKYIPTLSCSALLFCYSVNVFSKNIDISSNTRNKVSEIFGSSKIQHSDKVSIRIENLLKTNDERSVVGTNQVYIRLGYRGNSGEIDLIAVFLDGNKKPLIVKIIPGESSPRRTNYFVRGKIENYCFKTNKVLVIVKKKNKLFANTKQFDSFMSDCAAH